MEMEENASDLVFPLTNKSYTHFKSRNLKNNGKTLMFFQNSNMRE